MKHKSLTATMVLLGVGIALSVWGDPTALSISSASFTVTSSSSTTLNFPISRSGDTSYDTFVQYQTLDGTALAGTDYTAAMGSLVIPAGTTSTMIPVTVAGSTSNQPDKTFKMQLLGGGGAARTFTPSFATQQTFATGGQPYSATTADLNGDGKPDLIVANEASNTVSVLLNSTAPGATTPSFATQQTFATGGGPFSVAVADVNGDGKPDLIVANYNGMVSVLLNTTAPGAATPSFATQQTFATGNFTYSVTAADINGDGRPDLIVANFDDNTVSVLLNTTAPGATMPSFATQQTFATGNSPISVTVADVNGDGRTDLIAANYYNNTVSVLLNTTAPGAATPSFATQQTFATGNNPTSVAVADVNGDGKPDLIVANEGFSGPGGNTVSVLLNTTAPGAVTPSFATQQTFATGSEPFSVTAVDLNGDGKPDLIVANSDGTVSVLLNTTAPGATNPSFITQQTFATMGFNLFSVTAADVNGDGRPDLVVANYNDNTVSVLLNTTPAPTTTFDGNSFATQQTVARSDSVSWVTTGDVNGDGLPDLIVANASDNTVSVLLNTTAPGAATPSFATQQTFAVGIAPSSVTVADVNGDGLPDLIAANLYDHTVSVLLNTTAPGAATPSFATQLTFAVGSGPVSVTAADVNGDGKPDVIVANEVSDTVSVLLNTTAPGATTPSFATQQTFAVGIAPFSVTAADVNGDGLPDLIVANVESKTLSVLLNTTAPGATTPNFATQQTFATGSEPISVTATDVNGDGKPDLIVANNNSNTVSVLLNTTTPGAATPSFVAQQTFATGGGPGEVTTADVNGDGKPDLIAGNEGDGTVSVLLNTTAPGASTPSFASQQTFATGPTPQSVTTADLNGDGRPDLIVANQGISTVSVLLNTLYAATLSGSPATGTIHYNVPTPTASATATATATATPTAAATDTATATATSTATATQTTIATVTVTATSTATPTATPTTSMSVTASLAFGNVAVGQTAAKSVTIYNTGTSHPLVVSSAISSDPAEFYLSGTGTCGAIPITVAPKANCTLGVTFAPNSVGALSATLTLTDNATTSPQHSTVSGTGITGLTLSKTSLTYGSVKFGVKSALSFSVTNHQTQAVTLSESFNGTNAADFSITGCTATLAAKSSCSIIVTFTPGVLGTESATLTVADNPDPLSPYNVALSTGPTIPDTVLPTSLSFGNVAQSATRTSSVVKLTNLSPYTLTLNEGVSGPNAADFGVTPVASCAGNTVCIVSVSFTPSSEMAESATLTVTVDQDPTSPHLIALTGTGVTPVRLTPATTLGFGTVTLGKSRALTITVANLGTALLGLPAPVISGTNPADFTLTAAATTPCGSTLAGGASCHIGVTFKPSVAAAESASVAISASPDAASPHNVGLTGTGM